MKNAIWVNRIRRLGKDCSFSAGASPKRLSSLETTLGVGLPDELRSLLAETDGVKGEYVQDLIWPVERIERDNLLFRTKEDFRGLYMPFDPLLFFADAGNGDQFAYRILAGAVAGSDIYAWNHENDSRIWVAPSLDKYLEWWLRGTLKM